MSENNKIILPDLLGMWTHEANTFANIDEVGKPIKQIDNYKHILKKAIVYNIKKNQAINIIEKSIDDSNQSYYSKYLTYLKSCKLTPTNYAQLNTLLEYIIYNCNLNLQEIEDNKNNLAISDRDELLELVIDIISNTDNIDINSDCHYFENISTLSIIHYFNKEKDNLLRVLLELTNNTLNVSLKFDPSVLFLKSTNTDFSYTIELKSSMYPHLNFDRQIANQVIAYDINNKLSKINYVLDTLLSTPNY